mmetsp:Transcript_17341/g.25804  ORF Transcript_17341/g.25804 Transcript_17341/m.25804 type:complete len:211 (-) Transcript_17341:162-794(-)
MSDFPLSSELVKGFTVLKEWNEELLKEFTEETFNSLFSSIKENSGTTVDLSQTFSTKFKSIDPLALKQAYASMVSVILESGKTNTTPLSLKDRLEDFLSSNSASIVSKVYEQQQSALRQLLSAITFNFPTIVGVDWRLDYVIKNQSLTTAKPLYFVSLQTECVKTSGAQSNQIKEQSKPTVQFTCSLEQLQDLVDTLKDATKQAERVLNQ